MLEGDLIKPRSLSFVSENVDRALLTYLPANPLPERIELNKNIPVKYDGTITFSDNKSNRAQFICIPPDASVTHVKKLMLRHWCQHV
ncbi:unnamed protein product, partial [Rotaria magnacalcarata]